MLKTILRPNEINNNNNNNKFIYIALKSNNCPKRYLITQGGWGRGEGVALNCSLGTGVLPRSSNPDPVYSLRQKECTSIPCLRQENLLYDAD